MILHAEHVKHTQSKRERMLEAMRMRFASREAIELAAIKARAARRAQIEDEARERERISRAKLRAKLIEQSGATRLTLDDVIALRPCRRIAAVKAMCDALWQQFPEGITAEQAFEVGCTEMDISWVQHRFAAHHALTAMPQSPIMPMKLNGVTRICLLQRNVYATR